MVRLAWFPLACLIAACSGSDSPAPVPGAPPEVRTIDFGILPHGAVVTRNLAIPVPDEGAWFPIGFQRSCTCALHEFVAVAADRSERILTGAPDPDRAIRDDEQFVLRITIDTNAKEAADLAPVPTPGQVVLADTSGTADARYERVMLVFGIDAPIAVKPYAHLDVGDVARSTSYRQTLELVPDEPDVEFGEVAVVDAIDGAPVSDVTARLESAEGAALLHVQVSPGELRPEGPFEVVVHVVTNLTAPDSAPATGPGQSSAYVLRIPVSGRVVPDVELSPPGVFAFGRIPLEEPDEQRLIITDHDLSRPAGFVVIGIEDHEGRDLSEFFHLDVAPLESGPRSHVLTLTYRGGLERRFVRGHVRLAKAADAPPELLVGFSAFDRD